MSSCLRALGALAIFAGTFIGSPQDLPPCRPGQGYCEDGWLYLCREDGRGWRRALCGAEDVCFEGRCATPVGGRVTATAWENLAAQLGPTPLAKLSPPLRDGSVRVEAITGAGEVRLRFRFFPDVELSQAKALLGDANASSEGWASKRALDSAINPQLLVRFLESRLVSGVEELPRD